MLEWAGVEAWLKREGATLLKAPLTFIGAVAIGAAAGFWGQGLILEERMTNLKEELQFVQQRAGIVPSENKYENFTNSELRPMATDRLVKFRDFIRQLTVAYDRLYVQHPTRPGIPQNPADITEREFNNKFLETGMQFQDIYDRTLKIDLILIKQAMQKRTSSGASAMSEDRYQHTNMNTFVLRDLADDFERLLKNLP